MEAGERLNAEALKMPRTHATFSTGGYARQIGRLRARRALLQNPDDLLFREPGLFIRRSSRRPDYKSP